MSASTSTKTSNFLQPLFYGMAQMTAVKLSVTRSLFETQARIATLYGAPDRSDWFTAKGDAQSIEQGLQQVAKHNVRMLDALLDLQTQWTRPVLQPTEMSGERIAEDIHEHSTDMEKDSSDAADVAHRIVPISAKAPSPISTIEGVSEPQLSFHEEPKLTPRQRAVSFTYLSFFRDVIKRWVSKLLSMSRGLLHARK